MKESSHTIATPSFGSTAWGRLRNGRLTLSEQARFAAQTAVAQLRSGSGELQRRLGLDTRKLARLDANLLVLPDSSAVRRAGELIDSVAPPWLCLHSMRTWSWASLFAQMEALRPDPESLAISCLLHDIALAPAGAEHGPVCGCFAIEGALRASDLLSGLDWPEARIASVSDAIAKHMNVTVAPSEGIEAYLLHEGAALDVVGTRFDEIDEASRAVVLARYPRHGFKEAFRSAMRGEAMKRPGSRAALLYRLGIGSAIQRSPWTA